MSLKTNSFQIAKEKVRQIESSLFGPICPKLKKGGWKMPGTVLKYGNRDYATFAIEFDPRQEVAERANKVALQNVNKSFIW